MLAMQTAQLTETAVSQRQIKKIGLNWIILLSGYFKKIQILLKIVLNVSDAVSISFGYYILLIVLLNNLCLL